MQSIAKIDIFTKFDALLLKSYLSKSNHDVFHIKIRGPKLFHGT